MSVASSENVSDSISVGNLRGASNPVRPRRQSDAKNLGGDPKSVQFDQVALFQWLSRIGNECETLEQLLKGASEVVSCQAECLGLWVTQQDEDKAFNQIYSILTEPGAVEWDTFQVLGRRMLKLAAGSRQIQHANIPNTSHQLVVAPVLEGNKLETMVAGCFRISNDSESKGNDWLMGIFAQSISNWLGQRKLGKSEIRTRSLTDVVAFSTDLDRAENMQSAGLIIVNHLKRLTHAQQVCFATSTTKKLPKLLAISDLETVDHSLEATRATAHACGQAIVQELIVVYPERRKETTPADTLPLEQYCKSNGFDACVSLPIINRDEKVIGAILLAVAPKQVNEDGFLQYLAHLSQKIASHLELVLKANRSLTDHAVSSAMNKVSGRMGKITMAIAAGIVALMLIPIPYKVGCDCEIQPVLRRFIAAPHNGVLEKNLVENGDVVKSGQIVANLDGRQLRIELAGLEAELKGASKRRSAAMANNQIADAQIAMSEMKKFKADIQLTKNKLENLEIRSPINGIVVAGDLEKVEGAPVEMGQTLFEVGPLNRMLAEIAIPEQEIPYVKPGMDINIKLNAYPFETWHGTISKIHPKTEIQNQDSVFIAEVELENDDLNLKPGMKGRAKVISNAYPIGWNLFHQPMERLRYWMIW